MGAIMHNLEVIKKNVQEVWAPDTTGLLCTLIKDFPATAIVVRENALGCLPDKKSYDTNLQGAVIKLSLSDNSCLTESKALLKSIVKSRTALHLLSFKSIYTLDAEW